MAGEEESSSGCQSGWTLYLDQSYLLPPPCNNKPVTQLREELESESESEEEEEEEEEEDLSMVSDASSGPPHLDTEEQHSECGTLLLRSESRKKRKVDPVSHTKRDFSSSLDDTASSPMLNHSHSTGVAITDLKTTTESACEFSCAFSGTHIIKEELALREDTGYLQPIANSKLPKTTPIMYSNKKIERRHGDTFRSWSAQEQPMQEFL